MAKLKITTEENNETNPGTTSKTPKAEKAPDNTETENPESVITTIRVPGTLHNIEEILYENAKREICELNAKNGIEDCWLWPGNKCVKEFKDYTEWRFYEEKREPKIWNPWSWFGKYYYFYREEKATDELLRIARGFAEAPVGAKENEVRENTKEVGVEWRKLK